MRAAAPTPEAACVRYCMLSLLRCMPSGRMAIAMGFFSFRPPIYAPRAHSVDVVCTCMPWPWVLASKS